MVKYRTKETILTILNSLRNEKDKWYERLLLMRFYEGLYNRMDDDDLVIASEEHIYYLVDDPTPRELTVNDVFLLKNVKSIVSKIYRLEITFQDGSVKFYKALFWNKKQYVYMPY